MSEAGKRLLDAIEQFHNCTTEDMSINVDSDSVDYSSSQWEMVRKILSSAYSENRQRKEDEPKFDQVEQKPPDQSQRPAPELGRAVGTRRGK